MGMVSDKEFMQIHLMASLAAAFKYKAVFVKLAEKGLLFYFVEVPGHNLVVEVSMVCDDQP